MGVKIEESLKIFFRLVHVLHLLSSVRMFLNIIIIIIITTPPLSSLLLDLLLLQRWWAIRGCICCCCCRDDEQSVGAYVVVVAEMMSNLWVHMMRRQILCKFCTWFLFTKIISGGGLQVHTNSGAIEFSSLECCCHLAQQTNRPLLTSLLSPHLTSPLTCFPNLLLLISLPPSTLENTICHEPRPTKTGTNTACNVSKLDHSQPVSHVCKHSIVCPLHCTPLHSTQKFVKTIV